MSDTTISDAIRKGAIAHVRAKYPDVSGDQTDEEIWTTLLEQPVHFELLASFVVSLIEVIDGLEKRINALENPKQPWESP